MSSYASLDQHLGDIILADQALDDTSAVTHQIGWTMPPVGLSVSESSGLGKCVDGRDNQRPMCKHHTCTTFCKSILVAFKLCDANIEPVKDFRGLIKFDFDIH